MGDDLGEVGGGSVGMGGADGGEEAEGVFLDGGFRVSGGGVVEAVENHGNGVGRERSDGLLEVFDGDLVSVAVGEFREGS